MFLMETTPPFAPQPQSILVQPLATPTPFRPVMDGAASGLGRSNVLKYKHGPRPLTSSLELCSKFVVQLQGGPVAHQRHPERPKHDAQRSRNANTFGACTIALVSDLSGYIGTFSRATKTLLKHKSSSGLCIGSGEGSFPGERSENHNRLNI